MRNFSDRASKTVNILKLVLEIFTEIVLLPLKVIKTILDIVKELTR